MASINPLMRKDRTRTPACGSSWADERWLSNNIHLDGAVKETQPPRSLLRWIFRPRLSGHGFVAGGDLFAFPVLSAPHHQATLKNFCGGRHHYGIHRHCTAVLAPQPTNPHDRRAVVVTIQEQEVGFLERGLAPEFLRALRKAGCADAVSEAVIVHGWDRNADGQGAFGVRLNASVPFRLQSVQNWKRPKTNIR